MGVKAIYINKENEDKFNAVQNKSNLINKLLSEHFNLIGNMTPEEKNKKVKIYDVILKASEELKLIDSNLDLVKEVKSL